MYTHIYIVCMRVYTEGLRLYVRYMHTMHLLPNPPGTNLSDHIAAVATRILDASKAHSQHSSQQHQPLCGCPLDHANPKTTKRTAWSVTQAIFQLCYAKNRKNLIGVNDKLRGDTHPVQQHFSAGAA